MNYYENLYQIQGGIESLNTAAAGTDALASAGNVVPVILMCLSLVGLYVYREYFSI